MSTCLFKLQNAHVTSPIIWSLDLLERCCIEQMTEVIRNTNVLCLYASAQTPTKSSRNSFRSNWKGWYVEMLIIDVSIVIHRILKTTLTHNGRQHHHPNYTWDGECQTSLPLNLQLFVGVRMSYLRDLCLFEYNGFLHIFCCQFLWIVLFDCPFDIL